MSLLTLLVVNDQEFTYLIVWSITKSLLTLLVNKQEFTYILLVVNDQEFTYPIGGQ